MRSPTDEAAIKDILQQAKSASGGKAQTAAKALENLRQLRQEGYGPLLAALSRTKGKAYDCLLAILAEAGPQALPHLCRALAEDPSVSLRAAVACVRKIGVDSIPFLKRQLASPKPRLRLWAVQGLSELPADANHILPELAKLITDEDEEIAVSSLRGFLKLGTGTSEYVPGLCQAAADERRSVRILSLAVLEKCSLDEATTAALAERLCKAAMSPETDAKECAAVLSLLGRLTPTAELTGTVAKFIDAEDAQVQAAALEALSSLGGVTDSTVTHLLERLRTSEAAAPKAVLTTLASQKELPAEAEDLLVERVLKGDRNVQQLAMLALSRIPGLKAASREVLKGFARHEDPVLRLGAVDTLAPYVADLEVKKWLEEVAAKDGNRNVRAAAAGVLKSAARAASKEKAPFVLRHVSSQPPPVQLSLHTWKKSCVRCLAFSPDGSILAANFEEGVILWNTRSGTIRYLIRAVLWGNALAFSQDGHLLAIGDDDQVRIWDTEAKSFTYTFGRPSEAVHAVAFSPGGKYLAVGSRCFIDIWDLETTKPVTSASDFHGPGSAVAFSPDGTRCAACAGGSIRLWKASTWLPIRIPEGRRDDFDSVDFDVEGALLSIRRTEKVVELWQNGKVRSKLKLPKKQGRPLRTALSRDARVMAAGGLVGNLVVLWDVTTGKLAGTLHADGEFAYRIALSDDGRLLAAGGSDGEVTLWDRTTQRRSSLRTFWPTERPDYGTVRALAFSPDGSQLAIACSDTVRVWDLRRGTPARTLSGHSAGVLSVAYSPDGNWLASSSLDGTVRVWPASGGPPRIVVKQKAPIRRVAFSAQGDHLLTGSQDHTVRTWDVQTGEAVRTLTSHEDEVVFMALSRDGTTVASSSAGDVVKVFRAETGQFLRAFQVPCTWAPIALSPDGKVLASKFLHGQARIWDVSAGEERPRLPAQASNLKCLAFSPDGAVLATGTVDGTVTCWNSQTGQESASFIHGGPLLASMAFSPNGRLLAVATRDRLSLWDVTDKKLLITMVILPPREGEAESRDWLTYTPDGWFRGTARVSEFVQWQTSEELMPFETFGKKFERPDLIEKALSIYQP